VIARRPHPPPVVPLGVDEAVEHGGVEGLDAQSLISLRLMLRQLEVLGVMPTVLGALARVPRQRFVDRFWSPPQGTFEANAIREWNVGDDDPSQVAALLHDAHRALAVHAAYEWGDALSTLSAPAVIASLLQNLDVAPGMRVLEIGSGTGYTTALLAELAGDPSLVTSIEIDRQLSMSATERLAELGYAGVHLVEGDGDLGVEADAPYDRIIATVGCEDLSPAWRDQLTPDGIVVAPVSRGLEHPLVKASGRDTGFVGRVVDRSTFVRIQGLQAMSPSIPTLRQRADSAIESTSIPTELAVALETTTISPAAAIWGLEYYLALRAPATDPTVLVSEDGDSVAILDANSRSISSSGPHGATCSAELLARASDWVGLGSPTPMDYTSSWHLLPLGEDDAPGNRTGPWTCRRVHHLEVVELDWGAATL